MTPCVYARDKCGLPEKEKTNAVFSSLEPVMFERSLLYSRICSGFLTDGIIPCLRGRQFFEHMLLFKVLPRILRRFMINL